MEIVLEHKTVSCRSESFRQKKLIQEQAECIVSDIYEDIGKLAFAETQLFLRGKEHTAHGASITGSAEIHVFYITEDLAHLRCLYLTKEFTVDFDSDAIPAESILQVTLEKQGIQTRAVNSRKIAVQFSVGVELTAWAEDSFPLSVAAGTDETSGLQFLHGESECLITTDAAEKTFVISEQIPLPAESDPPTQIVCSHAELLCTEHQFIGSKLLLKGGAELRFAYETESGSMPVFSEQCIPFSVLIDSPGERSELGRLILQPTALYASIGDAINGSRVIEVELHAVAQTVFCETETVSYIADAFSIRCPMACQEAVQDACAGRSNGKQSTDAEEHSELDDGEYVVIAKSGELLSWAARDGKVLASATLSAILRADDGSLSAVQKLLSFEAPLPIETCELHGVRLASYDVRPDRGQIAFIGEAQFDYAEMTHSEIHRIIAAELDDDNPYDAKDSPSLLIVRQNGRSVWEMAKKYHASVSSVQDLTERYELPPNVLLIPQS